MRLGSLQSVPAAVQVPTAAAAAKCRLCLARKAPSHRTPRLAATSAMANTDPCLYMESLLDPATQADTGVRVMTLNRPDTLNSLTPEMADAFTQALQQLQDDQHKRVLVITGKGRAFSAGGDFSFIEERIQGEHSDNVRVLADFYRTFLALRQLPVPTIAAINGPAVGGGMGLALACDMRLAATTAKLSTNFVKLGITPGMGSSYLLPAAAGYQAACRMLLTGDLVGGEEAARLGLVLESHPPEQLLGAALKLAGSIAAAAPAAVAATLTMLREQLPWPQALAAAESEAAVQAAFFHGPDLLEGLAAIREKRPPRFGQPAGAAAADETGTASASAAVVTDKDGGAAA